MNHLDLLTFARGSALNWALMIFAAGVVLRLFEIFGLGRKARYGKAWQHFIPAAAGAPCSRVRYRRKAC